MYQKLEREVMLCTIHQCTAELKEWGNGNTCSTHTFHMTRTHLKLTHISHDQNTLKVDTVVLANDNHNTTMWLICSTLCTQHSLWNLAHTINTVLKPRWKFSTTLQPPFGSCLYLQYRSVQDLDRRPKRHYLCFIQKLYWLNPDQKSSGKALFWNLLS